jgi:hypothetical protein
VWTLRADFGFEAKRLFIAFQLINTPKPCGAFVAYFVFFCFTLLSEFLRVANNRLLSRHGSATD